MFKDYRKFSTILISLLLISSIFLSNSTAFSNKKEVEKSKYILEFKEESISDFKAKISNYTEYFLNTEKFSQKIAHYKDNIHSLHKKAKDEISLLAKEKNIFGKEFNYLFNGIVIKSISQSIVKKIKKLPYVEDITPDYKIKTCLDDSVPSIHADDVWEMKNDNNMSIKGENITIAFIDTGVDYTHPDLTENYIGGYDFINNDSDPMDKHGHGTHCAGIAVGSGVQSNNRYVGVAPAANFYAYKALSDEGVGRISVFIEAMERAVDPNNDGDTSDHVDIISISSGNSSGNPDDPLSEAANNAVEQGVVVVAAAGNNGPFSNSINSPGCAKKAIAVGASYHDMYVYPKSSRGPNENGVVKPDVVAPGVNIVSARAKNTDMYNEPSHVVGEYYYRATGTSMATPHVTGTAALILQNHPNWTPYEVKMAVRNTAHDLNEDINEQGYGFIDSYKAVNLSGSPPIAVLNTSGRINEGIVDVKGTASSMNFEKYILYYAEGNNWRKLYEKDDAVVNGTLFELNINDLGLGENRLKLEVYGNNQTSKDIVFVYVNSVMEKTVFSVNTSMYGLEGKAWFILLVPFHIPRLKYGREVDFVSPPIVNSFKNDIEGKIVCINLFDEFNITSKEIVIFNS